MDPRRGKLQRLINAAEDRRAAEIVSSEPSLKSKVIAVSANAGCPEEITFQPRASWTEFLHTHSDNESAFIETELA